MFLNRSSLYLLTAIAVLFFTSVSAQENGTLHLSLNEAIAKAEESNYQLRIAQAEYDAMQADLNKSLAAFLPQITLSETFVRTTDPLNVFGLKLKQEIVTQADFNPMLLNDPDEFENYNTKVEVKQPIINLDGFWGRAAAADGLAAMRFKKQRTENYINFMVKMHYHKIELMNKSLSVVNQALETAYANRKLITDYYDEGLITKADRLMAEVYVANLESKKAEVEGMRNDAMDELRHVLGIEDDVTIVTTDSLTYNDSDLTNVQVSSVLHKRSDLMAYGYRVDAMNSMHTMNWMKFLPRLNAFGSYEYNDTDAFGTNADNWMVGLNLQWDVFNGFQNIAGIQKAKAELMNAEAEYQKALSQGKNEINSAMRDVETAKKKLKLAEAVVDQSTESLRIIKDRYKKGLEKTADLLTAETKVSDAKLTHLQTLFAYNVSLYKAELMTEEKIIKQ